MRKSESKASSGTYYLLLKRTRLFVSLQLNYGLMPEVSSINAGSYPVLTGEGVFTRLADFLEKEEYSSIFILVDENTLAHCLPLLVGSVKVLQDAEILEIDSGEENKNIEVCAQLWSAMSELGADRRSLLLNLGGGVIGDMGGFIASTFKRGIDFINVPTTLLAQVDASIGGKTGIDLGSLKNEVGVFANPRGVYVYPDFLYTLDERQLRSGFSEMIKHALIEGKDQWKRINAIDPGDADEVSLLIHESIEIKNRVVLSDPKEKGPRKVLNFGHTIGHAIESYALGTSSPLLHGEAIAAGMICEAYLSSAVTGLSAQELKKITSFITSHFAEIKLPKGKDKELLKLMRHDKKNTKGQLNFSLLKEIGKCVIDQHCNDELIIESLNYYRQQTK
jgi:3-dehydroquinate synthase